MRLMNVVVLSFVSVFALCGQDAVPSLLSPPNAIYPAIARAARIQGDVRLESDTGITIPVSGPPLLVKAAIEHWDVIRTGHPAWHEVVYHFLLIDPESEKVPVTVKRSNAVGRIILRSFHQPTTKVVQEYVCASPHTVPRQRIDDSHDVIEIWVYAPTMCLMTESSLVAS